MISEVFLELKDLLWGVGITSAVIGILILLPKKYSIKLGQRPVLLLLIFSGIIFISSIFGLVLMKTNFGIKIEKGF